MARKSSDVGIVVTANHVYLPVDDDGNGRADWQAAEQTARIEKRTRLKVPADLAKFLSDRDQAEILTPSPDEASA